MLDRSICESSSEFNLRWRGSRGGVWTRITLTANDRYGATGGVLPFTEYGIGDNTSEFNSINVGQSSALNKTLAQLRRTNVAGYAIQQELQGISAEVDCRWSPTSPIEETWESSNSSDGLDFVTTTAKTCDPSFSERQYAPHKRAFAFDCADGNLYIRLFDTYVRFWSFYMVWIRQLTPVRTDCHDGPNRLVPVARESHRTSV